jgi:hypothetical protein
MRDQMEGLELQVSSPMMLHQFAQGLTDHAHLLSGPYLNKLLSEGKNVDAIALVLHSIATIGQKNQVRLNTSKGRRTVHGQRLDSGKKEKIRCHHCGKRGHLKNY